MSAPLLSPEGSEGGSPSTLDDRGGTIGPGASSTDSVRDTLLVTDDENNPVESRLLLQNAWLAYSTAALIMLSTALLAPSMWLYIQALGGSETLLGGVISAYALGITLGSLFFGRLYGKKMASRVQARQRHDDANNHESKTADSFGEDLRLGTVPLAESQPTRNVLLWCLGLMIVGNVLYPLATLVDSPYFSGTFLVLSRFIEGLGASLEVILVNYFALVSEGNIRTRHYTAVKLSGTVAVVFGPALSIALSTLGDQEGAVRFDEHTAPGWVALIMSSLNFAAIWLWFKEPARTAKGESDTSTLVPSQLCSCRNPFRELGWRLSWQLTSLLLLFYALYNCLSVYETIGTPVTVDFYAWDVLENSILWTGIGLCSTVGFLALLAATWIWQSSWKLDVIATIGSTLCLMAAFIIMLSRDKLPLARFVVGTGFVALVFPIAHTSALAQFSKLLPPSREIQGSMFGLFNVFGAFSRLVGPLWSGATYQRDGLFPVFTVTVVLLGFCLLLYVLDLRGTLAKLRSVKGMDQVAI